MTKRQLKKQLLAIAMKYMPAMEARGDFEYRNCDEDDFLEVSVGSIQTILEEAYRLGQQEANK